MVAVLTVSACGGSDLGGEQGAGSVADGSQETVAAPEQRDFDISGTWNNHNGEMVLEQSGSQITGEYVNGSVVGELEDTTLIGYWNHLGNGACEEERDGSTDWGTLELEFSERATSFVGEWAYCGGQAGGAWSGELVDGPAFEPVALPSNLPASTRYGYLNVSLESAGIAPGVGSDIPVSAKVEDDESALIMQVDIENLNTESGWTLSHTGLIWAEIDGDLYESVSSTPIELEPRRSESATVVFNVPSELDASSFRLWLQEAAFDADKRTKPAFIDLEGVVDVPFEQSVTTSFVNGSPDPGCDGTYTYSRWVLDDDAGFRENGAPAVDSSALRNNGYPILGRAPENGLLLTTFGLATYPPGKCELQVWSISPSVTAGQSQLDAISFIGTSVNGWGSQPTEDIWTFPVPADADSFTLTNTDTGFGAAAWTTEGTFLK